MPPLHVLDGLELHVRQQDFGVVQALDRAVAAVLLLGCPDQVAVAREPGERPGVGVTEHVDVPERLDCVSISTNAPPNDLTHVRTVPVRRLKASLIPVPQHFALRLMT